MPVFDYFVVVAVSMCVCACVHVCVCVCVCVRERESEREREILRDCDSWLLLNIVNFFFCVWGGGLKGLGPTIEEKALALSI